MRNVVIFPDTFERSLRAAGSAPLGNQALVHMAVLVSRPDSLGRLGAGDSACPVSLG